MGDDVPEARIWVRNDGCGPPPDPEMVEAALTDSDLDIRILAIGLFGESDHPTAIDAVPRLLFDAEPEVRATAAGALASSGDPRMAAALTSSALEAAEPGARAAPVRALAESGEPRLVGLIVERFADDPMQVKEATADALGALGDPGIDALICALSHAAPTVRRAAARVLGECAEQRALAPLRRLLEDPDRAVRAEAERAISRIG